MDFLELAKNRYSERFFDPRPIEQEKLDKILEAGRVVPTACNYQPQRFYVIRSKEALTALKQVTYFHYNAPMMILVCYDARKVWKTDNDRYYRNYNSGEQDASIAATTMMYKTVVDTFGLPEYMIPVMMLGLGYPNARAKAHQAHFDREPVESFVTEL